MAIIYVSGNATLLLCFVPERERIFCYIKLLHDLDNMCILTFFYETFTHKLYILTLQM